MLDPQCHELWKKSQNLSEQHIHHLNIFEWCRSKKMHLMLWRLRESSAIGCSYNFGWLYCRYWYKWKGNRLQICKTKNMDEGALECWTWVGWDRWAWEYRRWVNWVKQAYLPCSTITTFPATFVGTFCGGETGPVSWITCRFAVQILESHNGKQTQFWNR